MKTVHGCINGRPTRNLMWEITVFDGFVYKSVNGLPSRTSTIISDDQIPTSFIVFLVKSSETNATGLPDFVLYEKNERVQREWYMAECVHMIRRIATIKLELCQLIRNSVEITLNERNNSLRVGGEPVICKNQKRPMDSNVFFAGRQVFYVDRVLEIPSLISVVFQVFPPFLNI